MGHPTADDEPNSFVPDNLNGKARLVLTDETLVDIWVASLRGFARSEEETDPDVAKALLRTAADLIEQLVAHIHALEAR